MTFDTTRWDHTGFGGGKAGATPMLDAMAKRGTVFETCLTAQPLTLPSHTTIMTGLYPYHHGVRNNGSYIVGDENLTLAERLGAAGYDTHAVVSAFVLDSQFGLDQGFGSYDDDLTQGPKQKMFMFKETNAAQTTVRAAQWLQGAWQQDKPFFMWVHYFDPHADYEPPPDVAARFPGDPYTGEIHYADRELGRLFKELEVMAQLDNTLLIFTSDHGDGLGEHGEKTHGMFIYESTTRVPLLMSGPGVPRGKRVSGVSRTADIVPTVVDLLGLGGAEGLDGRSLRGMWQGGEAEREAYVETMMTRQNFGWSELRALRGSRYKAIQSPKPERFDLKTDGGENRNLVGWPDGDAPALAQMEARLASLRDADPFLKGEQDAGDIDPETLRKLQALGYVWADEAEPGAELPDPKDQLPYWIRFQAAQQLIREERYERAKQAIEALLVDDPDNTLARSSLAAALNQIGQKEEALAVFQDLIARGSKRETPYLGSARLLRELERFDEARDMAKQVIEMQPKNPDGYSAMGDALLDEGRFAEAEPWFRKSVDVDPRSGTAWSGLGNCLNRAGKLDEAEAVLTEGRRADPSSHAVAYNLAVVKERKGDKKAALQLYKTAIVLEPDHSMSWNNLAALLEKDGQRDKALKLAKKAVELDDTNVEAVYNLGALYLTTGQAKEAIPYLSAAMQLHPGLGRGPTLLATAYAQNSQFERARALLRQLTSSNPAAWLQLARVELAAGDEAAARAALESGVMADGDRFRGAAERDPTLRALLQK